MIDYYEDEIEVALDSNLHQWFYEPSPYVEQSLKNLFDIYEKDGYPQSWSDFKTSLPYMWR